MVAVAFSNKTPSDNLTKESPLWQLGQFFEVFWLLATVHCEFIRMMRSKLQHHAVRAVINAANVSTRIYYPFADILFGTMKIMGGNRP